MPTTAATPMTTAAARKCRGLISRRPPAVAASSRRRSGSTRCARAAVPASHLSRSWARGGRMAEDSSRGVCRISSMRETLLIICSCVKEGPRGPKGNSQKRKVTNGYKAYHTRFLPKSQDFDWKRRESAAIEGQSTTDTTYSGRLSKRCPTTTRRRNGQGRAAKRFVHFDRDEKPPRHPFWCRGGPEGTGDLPP